MPQIQSHPVLTKLNQHPVLLQTACLFLHFLQEKVSYLIIKTETRAKAEQREQHQECRYYTTTYLDSHNISKALLDALAPARTTALQVLQDHHQTELVFPRFEFHPHKDGSYTWFIQKQSGHSLEENRDILANIWQEMTLEMETAIQNL